MSPATLVLGTHNPGKVRELRDLLSPLDLHVRSLADLAHRLEVEETGDTFAANAALKASTQARHLGAWVLGEDSGISVDALDGAPGIYSARYAGPGGTDVETDERNNQRLLQELLDVPTERRTAHYVCQLALADPTGAIRAERGAICRGRIRREPAGDAGFGYDPLFEVIEYHRTFGELGEVVKSVLSHRTRAVQAMLPKIRSLLFSSQWPENPAIRPGAD